MKLGFGLMRLPLIGGVSENIDIEQFKKQVDIFRAAGGTYFDTAYMYHNGKSEEAFREAVVKRFPRDSYTITDKLPCHHLTCKDDCARIFNEQLERCGVEYFDYYWLHNLNRNTLPKAINAEAFAFIKEMKEAGKIKHLGFSFHDNAEMLENILSEHPEFEYVQIQLNYLDWEDENVQSRKNYEVCVKYNKPVIVMEPVKGGSLANIMDDAGKLLKELDDTVSQASFAVRFAASLPNVYMVLSGMSNTGQVEDNVSYMNDASFKPLNDKERSTVLAAAEILRAAVTIPCTKCRYCMEVCPINMAIPNLFEVYNNYKKFNRVSASAYGAAVSDYAKPSECLKCGACEGACPQQLEIRKWLEIIAEEVEAKQ